MRLLHTLAVLTLASHIAACRSDSAVAPASYTSHRAAPVEVVIPGRPYKLRGEILIPEGKGPFAALVYNHGSERDPSLHWMGDTGQWFRQRGFIVLFPYRRGAGGSDGPYWQDEVGKRPVGEQAQATVEALEAQGEDVMASVDWLARRPEVDPKRIAVAGCSFGGIVSVLAAERGDRIGAAIDFAGASMTWAHNESLRERMKRAVRGAKVPIFFVQAANDFDTTPTKALAEEMATAGKPHAQNIFPPHGTTAMQGHAHFCNHGQAEWGPDVLAFLQKWRVGPDSMPAAR